MGPENQVPVVSGRKNRLLKKDCNIIKILRKFLHRDEFLCSDKFSSQIISCNFIGSRFNISDNVQYNYGFVLSGGAARGFAHLGVAKALAEEGIRPDILSGASAGSIVGAYLADGYLPEEILEIFLIRKLFQFVQFTIPHFGFLSLEGLEEVLEETLHAKTFEELKIPLYISATNCNKGEIVYFHKGALDFDTF